MIEIRSIESCCSGRRFPEQWVNSSAVVHGMKEHLQALDRSLRQVYSQPDMHAVVVLHECVFLVIIIIGIIREGKVPAGPTAADCAK